MAVKRSSKSLANGRPPTAHKPKTSLSSQATRTLIRSHHQLNKRLDQAKSRGDDAEKAKLQKQIDALGGLKSYQQASIQGQSTDRGGDSSLVLMKWLDFVNQDTDVTGMERLKMLEVGALSKTNACSRSGLFHVERIDLNSQGDGILQQDFMQRPPPSSDAEKFDIVSLSLVLNYVPDAAGRGEMLRRTCQFLDRKDLSQRSEPVRAVFPALFLVLPAPCVTNSRYNDEARLRSIMESLGYDLLERKLTAKLVYYLWRFSSEEAHDRSFEKREVNSGKSRNNFSIVLESSGS